MRKWIPCAVCVFLALNLSLPAVYAMESGNYRMPTCVLSGGGVPAASQNYQTEATVGQPSPLTEQVLLSDHYALYSGFWYTIEAFYGGGPMPWLLLLLDDEQETELW